MRIRKPDLQPVADDFGRTYPVFEGKIFWQASKNRSYRECWTRRLESLHQFFELHGLYSSKVAKFAGPEEFVIWRDDLSDKGLLFAWRYLDGYLQHLDRTRKIHNPKYLEACWQHLVSN